MDVNVAALFVAIQAGDHAAVGAMLKQDPTLASQRNDMGLSAVMWACYLRQPEVRDVVLAAGPSLDLFDAIAVGDEAGFQDRLAADPSLAQAWSADGFTALHLAAFFARTECVRGLLAAGADVAAVARNPMSVMPLHSAVAAHALDSVRLLLAAGAPVDAAQHQGWTVLMSAGQHGDLELAELLLERGADPTLRAEDGRTAIDLAEAHGHRALADRLRSARGA